ncbi:hypothetical protein RI129_004773 [Pyrocoelia pectoralis]|uniref:E3 ubiquitin-protein ligase APD1-4 middle domain-containing protein n=1 Tax=Pyrocoelia pectoralis TaxID=417401 RepID=A0AAN7VM61_9COLE
MKPSSGENVIYYNGIRYSSINNLDKIGSMHGVKRVVVFCIMTTVLPALLIITPLYLRHVVFADVPYALTESDVVEIKNGISSIFCAAHSLQMNVTFNAIQLDKAPIISDQRKHVRLRKTMSLPDDTLEYWGFYLLKGATVNLKVCSRYDGARILVVRGEKNLRTCGLMERNVSKFGAKMDREYKQVKFTFESAEGRERYVSTKFPIIDGGEITDDNDLQNIHNDSETELHLSVSDNIRKEELQRELLADDDEEMINRVKRDIGHLLDTKIEHGGNAINFTDSSSDESSASSFETSLLNCYNGQILLTEAFPPSHLCTGINYLENGERMETIHSIVSDGYYYYIFYSDNDEEVNDIYGIFDIHKPTLLVPTNSETKTCNNITECIFPMRFWRDETVIVEVPMKEGIVYQQNDTILISTCQPRMSVYIIFPVAIMVLILGCAFI